MSNVFDTRALRLRIGWRQDRMGRYLGLDRSSVSRLEKGGRARGSTLILLRQLEEAAETGLDAVNALCPDLEPAQ